MTGRRLAVLPAAPFARHRGRHRRRWFPLPAQAERPALVVDDFSRVRKPALAPVPVGDPIPCAAPAAYRHPYSPKDAA